MRCDCAVFVLQLKNIRKKVTQKTVKYELNLALPRGVQEIFKG